MNNKNNNKRLTLKALKEQLDKLQNNHNAPINNIKSSFKIIYLISLLGYIIGKIPFLNKYIKGIKSVVAKTSIWSVLVILRKTFIVMNALIGMWLIFKITGWSEFSFIGIVSTFGNAYIDIFSTFCLKAFNWIYELFDTKIVPDIPSNKPKNPWSQTTGWNVRPMSQPNYMEIAESAKSWYSSPTPPANDSWLTSWKTWAFIGGSIITIFALYTGYVFVSDWFKGPNVNTQAPPQDAANSKGFFKTVADVLVINRIANVTNGLSQIKEYFIPSMSEQDFHNVQFNRRVPYQQKFHQYWPFTAYDPSDPWYDRLRKRIVGETSEEESRRKLHLGHIKGAVFTPKQPIPPIQPEFVQGSSSNPINNTETGSVSDYSPIRLGFPDLPNPSTKPVVPLSDEVLATINYPHNTNFLGDPKTPVRGGFFDKLDEVTTNYKLNKLPKTPISEPNVVQGLSPEAVADIDKAAAELGNKGKNKMK